MAIENNTVERLQAHNFKAGHKVVRHGDTSKKQSDSRKVYLKENPPIGKRNPFYGKHHTEKYKVARRKLLGRKISCEGVEYDSVKFAAESMSVTRSCINYRLKTRGDYFDI